MSDPTQNPPQEPGQPGSEGYSAPPPPPPQAPQPGGYQQPGPPPAGYGQPPGQQPGQPGQPQGGYPPAPGYGTAPATGGVGQPADLLMRFLARLIDFILVGIVNAIITAILIVGILGMNAGGFGMSTGGGLIAGIVSSVVTAALYLAYFGLLESKNGQTLGKLALKLQTQGPDGRPPSMEQAVKRNIWVAFGLLGIVPIVGGLIGSLASLAAVIAIAVTINSSPTKQGWHDNFAGGTKVIKIG